jgi:hypothetical protein
MVGGLLMFIGLAIFLFLLVSTPYALIPSDQLYPDEQD